MRRYLATFGVACALGTLAGWAFPGPAPAPAPAPTVAPTPPPPPPPDPAPRGVERERLDRDLASTVPDRGPWAAAVPGRQGVAAVMQRIDQVDSPIHGPDLPHHAQFLDVDCVELPCVFALWVPPVVDRDVVPFRIPPGLTDEVTTAFGDWLDLGRLGTPHPLIGVQGELYLAVELLPDSLPEDEEGFLVDLDTRKGRMVSIY